jgi:N-methylhydantoinase A/oxoprolinase/acetone carboxylase beta subunit
LRLSARGCGQSDDRETVQETTQRFLTAYAADQNETACRALSADTVKELESQEGAPCPEAVGKVALAGGQVAAVEVSVTNAKVDLTTRESTFLSEQAERLEDHGARMPLRGQAGR